MGAESLGIRIRRPTAFAQHILNLHRSLFWQYWEWSDQAANHALLYGWQQTVFGWRQWLPPEPNPRSLRDFHMQANGAEMLRLAICLATEAGILVCAPVHDGILIMAPLNRLQTDVVRMKGFMAEASRIVLNGFELSTESKEFDYPDHYEDKDGRPMWNTIWKLIKCRAENLPISSEILTPT